MLGKKMLRELVRNFGQFVSIFILAFLAVSLFACMKASNISAYNKRAQMYEQTNMASGWIYGEGFSEEDLKAVRDLADVEDAERRMHVTATAKEQDQAQLEVYLLNENLVAKPYYISGEEFDVKKTDEIWLSESFAKEWGIRQGDEFSFLYNGLTITKKVGGLVVSPEYQYLKADKDLDVVRKNISVVYMAYQGFPAKDYVKSLIEKGDLTLEDAMEHSEMVREQVEKAEQLGLARESLKAEDLIKMVDKVDDDKIYQMLPYTELIFTTKREDVKGMERELSDALKGNYAVFCDRDDIAGIKVMSDELAQHDQFAVTFPVVFIAIALLVLMTTMNRMIAQQRTQIGTMRALGMPRRKIIFHYLSYSLLVSALGSVAGLYVGTYGLGEVIAKIFRDWYYIPGWTVEMDGSFLVVALLMVFVCTAATYLSCRKVMNIHPAESLRPAPPKSGKKTLFEKLPFWNRLGFRTQYNLRDISRGKLRAFMGVFGTAAGMMIMIAAFASFTTIQDTADWTFGKLKNYTNEIDFEGNVSLEQAEELQEKYDGELISAMAIEIAKSKNAVADEKKMTTLIVNEGKDFDRLTDTQQRLAKLKPGTVALTKKLADYLGVKSGDKVYWHLYEKNAWYEAEVGLINRNPNLQGMTMLREDYEKTGAKYVPSMLYTNADLSGFVVRSGSGILAVHDDRDLRESFDVMMEMIYAMIGVFILFAIILPVVVLYNCGNLSFHERVKEFATLKVLGFTTQKIRSLLALQNLWLSILGVFLGAPFGTVVLQYMFDSNGDSMDYQVGAGPVVYLLSGVFVLLVSVLVSFMFNKRIRRLDMVETLKGME